MTKSVTNQRKVTYITRLERHAAVIVCRMKNSILEQVKHKVTLIHFWYDSKAAIIYLNNETTNLGIYIAHRINETREGSNTQNCHNISTKLDVLTYFPGFKDFLNQSQRFNGPEFFREEKSNFSKPNCKTKARKEYTDFTATTNESYYSQPNINSMRNKESPASVEVTKSDEVIAIIRSVGATTLHTGH